jgi:hypothetical protein
MTQSPPGENWSPSVNRALQWAEACGSLNGSAQVSDTEVFLGVLLAHPDQNGEMRTLLSHFGLTGRDLLPDGYPAITVDTLRRAAATVSQVSADRWDDDVEVIVRKAGSLSGGAPQLAHLMGALLEHPTPWRRRLETALSWSGVQIDELSTGFRDILPDLDAEAPDKADVLELRGGARGTAGQQIAAWLVRQFPHQPTSLATFASDAIAPQSDFVGVSAEADAFAYLVASRALVPPLAIGLFGNWGSGKSFLMAKIRRRVAQLTALASNSDAPDVSVWGSVTPIEFNAWQYVETDLWAALLHHIFEKLSPQALEQLADLDDHKKRVNKKLTEGAQVVKAKELAVSAAVGTAATEAEAVSRAERELREKANHAEQLRDSLISQRLEARAPAVLADRVIASGASILGADVEQAVGARASFAASHASPWWQTRFWTKTRLVLIGIAVVAVPLLALLVQYLTSSSVAAAATMLSLLGACLAGGLRALAGFAEERRLEFEEVQQQVDATLAEAVSSAEADLEAAKEKLATSEDELAESRRALEQARDAQADLHRQRDELTPGSYYETFLAGRSSSDEYRKRLTLVTTVQGDLEQLSRLSKQYNDSATGTEKDGPPNRIVLYIDDLDRCPPRRVVEVLEAVHLLLAFPLFVVVVAVDTRWLESSLSEALPALAPEEGEDKPSPQDYVEKIFQIPFWIESIDDGARQRLLRGLLLPSVVARSAGETVGNGRSVMVGKREEELVSTMLTVSGHSLDLDARQLAFSQDELAFIETLAPLVRGTPRQVKRFVNICHLLLSMAPPLSAAGSQPTARMAACFLAAVHEASPRFAERLVQEAASADPASPCTLKAALASLGPEEFAAERARLQAWMTAYDATRADDAFDSTKMAVITQRWNMVRRLRFGTSGEVARPFSTTSSTTSVGSASVNAGSGPGDDGWPAGAAELGGAGVARHP